MMDIDALIDKHYGSGGIMENGKNVNSITIDDLAPIDEFHTRGRESTVELAMLANLKASDVVLDVGCGLGGTARHLATQFGCHLVGIDLTEEYISVGKKLTKLVSLSDRVELRHGSALEIPYEDERFDIVWTEHVQMNIANKNRFYSEIERVLKPGGFLLFHDVFRGSGDSPFYPAPWAEDESISALATEMEVRAIIEKLGMEIDHWIGKIQESIEFFKRVSAQIDADGPPPIGIHLLMGDNAREKLQNYVRNLSENRVTVAMGTVRKK
jgi:ubiquinone/menaquinone biosynthesis C-methylase UbiE